MHGAVPDAHGGKSFQWMARRHAGALRLRVHRGSANRIVGDVTCRHDRPRSEHPGDAGNNVVALGVVFLVILGPALAAYIFLAIKQRKRSRSR